jgi:hypothetical protein
MTIARTSSLALGMATLVLLARVGRSENSLPAIHPEPVTIQVLDGKGGAPLAHVHVQLVAGYDDRDLRLGLWSEDAITDGKGRASLPNVLKNFTLVEVWVAKHKLCEGRGRSPVFILDRIRHEGSSTPNYCGTTVVEDTPGVINVFVRAHKKGLSPPASPATKPACEMIWQRRMKMPHAHGQGAELAQSSARPPV